MWSVEWRLSLSVGDNNLSPVTRRGEGRGGVTISWAQPPLSSQSSHLSLVSTLRSSDHGNGGPGVSPGELAMRVTHYTVTPPLRDIL